MIDFFNKQGYYILFYLIIFTFLLILLKVSHCKSVSVYFDKKEMCIITLNKMVYLSILILTILSAIRYNVGADYHSYTLYFSRSIEYLKEIDGLEDGFIKLIEIVKHISNNENFFIGILSCIYGILFTIFVVYNKQILHEPTLFFALYMFSWQYMYSLNVVRACISAVCIMICISALQNKHINKFFFYGIIGFLFHRTTIILLLLIILVKKFEIKKIHVIIYMGILIPLFINKDKIITFLFSLGFFQNVRYQSYMLTGYFGDRNLYSIIPVLPRLFLWIIIIILFKIKGENDEEKFYLSLFNYNMIITLSEIFFELAWRMMLSTWIADYFVYYMTIRKIKKKSNLFKFKLFLIIYLSSNFILYSYLDQSVFPYTTIFLH